jgi:hypothetical protein
MRLKQHYDRLAYTYMLFLTKRCDIESQGKLIDNIAHMFKSWFLKCKLHVFVTHRIFSNIRLEHVVLVPCILLVLLKTTVLQNMANIL